MILHMTKYQTAVFVYNFNVDTMRPRALNKEQPEEHARPKERRARLFCWLRRCDGDGGW